MVFFANLHCETCGFPLTTPSLPLMIKRTGQEVSAVIHPQKFDPRQVMIRPDFELQFKRDASLQDVQLHHHDFYEVYLLLSGDVTYTIEGRIYRVMPGDMLLINPRELHQVCIRAGMSAYERYTLWVDPQLIRRLSTDRSDLLRCFDPDRPNYGNLLQLKPEEQRTVQALFEALWREYDSAQYGSDLLRQSLLAQLLVTVNRLAEQDTARYDGASRSSRIAAAVVEYVNLHYGEPISLDLLAEHCFVSKYHLSHEFQRQLGTSVHRYILKKRLLNARQLMAEGEAPSRVFSRCGFGDYAGFYRAFRAEYGVAPREYALSVCPSPERAGSEG